MGTIVSNGIEFNEDQVNKVMNDPNLLQKIQQINPEITHFPGNWEFISNQKKLYWFTKYVNFSIMLNWFE